MASPSQTIAAVDNALASSRSGPVAETSVQCGAAELLVIGSTMWWTFHPPPSKPELPCSNSPDHRGGSQRPDRPHVQGRMNQRRSRSANLRWGQHRQRRHRPRY